MRTAPTSRRGRLAAGIGAGLLLAGTGAAAAAFEAEVPLPIGDPDLDGGRSLTAGILRLPPSVEVERATLRIDYANALAVDPDGSALTVSLGELAIAELPLIAAQGDVQAEIDVPPSAFAAGPHALRLEVRQRHRAACSRDAFGELWTRVDLATSHLALDLRPRPDRLTLAALDSVLGASLYDGEPLTVATGRPLNEAVVLEWGGLIAEGSALRRGDRPLEIRHAELMGRGRAPGVAQDAIDFRTIRGQNVVVVGTIDEVGHVLPTPLPDGAGLGLIALRPLPADPLHVAIIVSGENDAAVTRAAQVFRSLDADWPEAAAMPVTFAPARQAEQALPHRPVLEGGEAVRLRELGYVTDDLPISFTETIDVEVMLPETYYAGDGQRVELSLDYAYGAGLAPTSSLIIRLNGAPWNMLRLDRAGGHLVEGARVELPMGMFRPGRNVIGIEPILHPAEPGLCEAMGEKPMFSLFDDSSVHVPAFADLARQPDLKLFASTGFPFAAAGGGVEMVLADLAPETVEAAWMLRGKLAQMHGRPLADIATVRRASGERHILAVGPAAALPAELIEAAPLPLTVPVATPEPAVDEPDGSARAADLREDERTRHARQHWSQRVLLDGGGDDNVLSALARWVVSIARAMPISVERTRPSFAELDAVDASGSGSLVAFRSPYADDRTAAVVTVAGGGSVAEAVRRMVEPDVWNHLDGDVSVWSGDSGAVLSHRVAEPYVIREVEKSPRHLWLLWRTFMAERPGYWLILVFGLVVVLTLVTGRLLRHRARRVDG